MRVETIEQENPRAALRELEKIILDQYLEDRETGLKVTVRGREVRLSSLDIYELRELARFSAIERLEEAIHREHEAA